MEAKWIWDPHINDWWMWFPETFEGLPSLPEGHPGFVINMPTETPEEE